MKTIVLVSCVKNKLPHAAKARDLYTGAWFVKAFSYAQSLRPDRILILSAKYHLLDPEKVVEPYDLTLKNMSRREQDEWARQVILQLKKVADLEKDHFIILAGKDYRRFLVPELSHYEAPLERMRIGEQLHFLTEAS